MKDYLNEPDRNVEDQIERIRYMDGICKECREAADKFEKALAEFYAVQGKAAELSAYRNSGLHNRDRIDRAAGLFPEEIGENVLTEDVLSGLLTDNHELIAEMLEKAAKMVRITP